MSFAAELFLRSYRETREAQKRGRKPRSGPRKPLRINEDLQGIVRFSRAL